MEIQSQFGADPIPVPTQSRTPTILGRFNSRSSVADRTVSRRHLSLIPRAHQFKLYFTVIGKNPITVLNNEGFKLYKNGERGEMGNGDRFSMSVRDPEFWAVRCGGGGDEEEEERGVIEAVARREKITRERRERDEVKEMSGSEGEEVESELGDLVISEIDAVRDFGFLVKGHEFDSYPKQKMRPPRQWNWYLEDPEDSSSDDEFDDEGNSRARVKRKTRRKRKSGQDVEDEEWTGGSDNEKETVPDVGSGKRAKYSTRSSNSKKPSGNGLGTKRRAAYDNDEEAEEEDDEEDETLGGFIVESDNEVEPEIEDEETEEEEEEFDDEEEDD